MPVRGWKGFPREQTELLAAVKEVLDHLDQLDHFYKTPQLEQAEQRLDAAADDFAFKNAVT
jgi:hypothetical protein